MKTELIEKAYAVAKDRYAAVGVDTDAVLDQLQKQQISLHRYPHRRPHSDLSLRHKLFQLVLFSYVL